PSPGSAESRPTGRALRASSTARADPRPFAPSPWLPRFRWEIGTCRTASTRAELNRQLGLLRFIHRAREVDEARVRIWGDALHRDVERALELQPSVLHANALDEATERRLDARFGWRGGPRTRRQLERGANGGRRQVSELERGGTCRQ